MVTVLNDGWQLTSGLHSVLPFLSNFHCLSGGVEEGHYSCFIFALALYVSVPFMGGKGGGIGSMSHGDDRMCPNLLVASSPTLGFLRDTEEPGLNLPMSQKDLFVVSTAATVIPVFLRKGQ